jgi:hypothetical protein
VLMLVSPASPVLVARVLAAAVLVKPGRGWVTAVAGWMVGAFVLWYASVQGTLWIPFGWADVCS